MGTKSATTPPVISNRQPTAWTAVETKNVRKTAEDSSGANDRPLRARKCCSFMGLRAIGQTISRELSEVRTSLLARAARIATSRTGFDAFVEAFSVIPKAENKTDPKKAPDFNYEALGQYRTAIDAGLCTRFAQVRESKSTDIPTLKISELPEVLTHESYRPMNPATLDKLLQHCLTNGSAESLLFLISAEKLSSSSGKERSAYASKMQHAFTDEGAELAPNLSSKNRKNLTKLLNELAEGGNPQNMNTVLDQTTKELVKAVGEGPYMQWRHTLA